jgi:superfamily II DNA or RNA helicase
MLRLLLPPNLPAAAARDAIAVRLELGGEGLAPSAEELPALARIQAWCGASRPPSFLQLTRAQLRELIRALIGQPAFFRVEAPGQPLLWVGPILRGVSEHLAEPEAAPAPAARTIPVAPRPKPPREASTPLTVDGSEHYLALTLPSREHAAYQEALALVKGNGFTLEPATRKWWLRDRHKTLNFLAAHGAELRDTYHAEFTPNFAKNTAHLAEAAIACEIAEADGGFALTLGLETGQAEEGRLLAAIASSRSYVEGDGRVFLLPPPTLERLARAQRALAGDPDAGTAAKRQHRIAGARIAEVQELVEELAPHYQPPEAWRQRGGALRNLAGLAPAPMPAALASRLRPYQRLGVAWLWHLWRHRLGGILADEMGLGKTPQALALLAAGRASPEENGSPSAPALVVCPASLVENWRREAANFTPALRVFVHHGARRLDRPQEAGAHDLVITSYGTLTRDREFFARIEFGCLIADEAQHVKNRRTQNARALRALRARSRFLLTGTPVENSLDDLRALFDLLMPGYLDPVPAGTRGDQRAWFDERLRAKTAPYILRRTKQAVAPELPAKIEQTIWCELAPPQAALYREMQQNSERELIDLAADGASENALRMATLTQLLRLRQICCDPRLVDANRSAEDSAKLEAFRELLAEAIDDGHRLLVFSQFTSLLALLRAELEGQEIAYCQLDGSMSTRRRQEEVDRFQGSPAVPVFLISLKAGGTGLNLTGADTVVHFDPWWNPAVEAQATDRAHRIGQQRVVTSYKLFCAGTVEEKVLQLQESKRALLADVFEASDAATAKLSLADLRDLLRE